MERVKRFTINREGIGFFKAILESYEEVALMTVLDGNKGVIEVLYPSDQEDVVRSIIHDMERFHIVFTEVGNV